MITAPFSLFPVQRLLFQFLLWYICVSLIFVSSSASFASVLSFGPLFSSILSVFFNLFLLVTHYVKWFCVNKSHSKLRRRGELVRLPLFSSSLPPLHDPTSYRCSSASAAAFMASITPWFTPPFFSAVEGNEWLLMTQDVKTCFSQKVKSKHKHKAAKSNCPHFCMFWCHAGLTDLKFFFTLPLQKQLSELLLYTPMHTHTHTHTHRETVNLSLHACMRVCECVRTLWSCLGPEIKAMSASVWWDLTDDG